MSVFDYLDQEPGAPPQPRVSDLWQWAQDDYFAGESADVVCERHKLSRSQFFERARREGWLRRDQPRNSAGPAFNAEEEEAFVEDALDRPPPSAFALYRRAWARAERAILMGRRVDAAGWTRLARDLRKLALEENGGDWSRLVNAGAAKPDSADSPNASAPVIPVSPAKAGAQSMPWEGGIKGAPPPEPSRTWAPAFAGEVEKGEPNYPDSADSKPSAPLTPASPAKAGAQSTPSAGGIGRVPPPEHARTWAPACAGEEEEGGPDSADSLSAAWAPLNRQERRRLAKLGGPRGALSPPPP